MGDWVEHLLVALLLAVLLSPQADAAVANPHNVYVWNGGVAGMFETTEGTNDQVSCDAVSASFAAAMNRFAAGGVLYPSGSCTACSWPTTVPGGACVGMWTYDTIAGAWLEDEQAYGVTLLAAPAAPVFGATQYELLQLAIVALWCGVWGVGFIAGQQR